MDNICDSALNCEMSELESLCEDVLDDEEISGSANDANENEGLSRQKRDSSLSVAPTQSSRSSTKSILISRYPRYRSSNNLRSLSNNANQRVYSKSRAKSRWVVLRKKRRRRRRSRVKLLFKMIGNYHHNKYYISLVNLN